MTHFVLESASFIFTGKITMKRLRRFRIELLATGIWALTACATATAPKAPITPEHLLQVLVQIATQEDLADEKRIGSLLGLDIVMIPEPPFEMKDGRMGKGATALYPNTTSYLSTWRDDFYYRHITSPVRRANFSLGFNHNNLCINYKDALAEFGKHGQVRPGTPPLVTPLPNGAQPAHLKPWAQPIYSYEYKGTLSAAALTFAYTECLISISINQPINDK
jgi:hypothetical protein